MPIYEFEHKNCKLDCPKQFTTEEILCKSDDFIVCDICKQDLTKLVSSCPGYVKGTHNYTKCK